MEGDQMNVSLFFSFRENSGKAMLVWFFIGETGPVYIAAAPEAIDPGCSSFWSAKIDD
jgi:hypothetical protein